MTERGKIQNRKYLYRELENKPEKPIKNTEIYEGDYEEMSIYVTQSSIASWDEFVEEIKPIFKSKRMTNMGPVYKKMQQQLIRYLDVPELSLFVNGHMALEMAIQTMDFPKGSEVITTPYTFVSTAHAIARNGLVPVF